MRSGAPTARSGNLLDLRHHAQVEVDDDSDWRPQKEFIAPDDKDYTNLRDWYLPVYACGYNWLDGNTKAAKRLQARIDAIIAENNNASARCEQVIVVTHSMGGLVARACQQLDGMVDKIAGIVHGVMPADGAPVAYRRCKVGMHEESAMAGVVIGTSGQEVTAVFAQASGALQLLPTQRYATGWLSVLDADGKPVAQPLPQVNPYDEIYKRRDRWWALIKEEWLSPKDGEPIKWGVYEQYIGDAQKFHQLVTPDSYPRIRAAIKIAAQSPLLKGA